jgi:hypothetical protein
MAEETVLAFPWLAVAPPTSEGERKPGFATLQEYLERFGYMPSGDAELGALDEQAKQALARFQRISHVEETGEFDEPTCAAMMQPRCALPDPDPDRAPGEFDRKPVRAVRDGWSLSRG